MRVNGHHLNPGNFQILMDCASKEAKEVVYNCRNYRDAMVTFEELLNDPRAHLNIALRFTVLDHEGNVCRYGDFERRSFLRGEELAQRQVAWHFGHSDGVHSSSVPYVFVLLATGRSRAIYHAFWLVMYLATITIGVDTPLMFLWIVWNWIRFNAWLDFIDRSPRRYLSSGNGRGVKTFNRQSPPCNVSFSRF
jgi:hypothetical protein